MWVLLSMYVLSIIGFFIHLFSLSPRLRTKPKIIELLLLYQIVFSLGITSLLAFIGFTFMPELVAAYIDWPACPFQQEVANVNLGYFVLGILAIWYRGHFWTATVIGFSIWIFTDGLHHIYEAIVNQNYAPGNIGIPLITDLAIPIILVILLIMYLKTRVLEKV